MYQIGVINQNYSEDEIKQLCTNIFHGFDCTISKIDIRDIHQENLDLDVVFIFSDSADTFLDTCSTIVKVRDTMNAYMLVYHKNVDSINRIVYLQLGANLNVGETSQPKEIQLTIRNELEYRSKIFLKQETKSFSNSHESIKKLSNPISELERKVNLTRKEYKLLSLLQSDIGKPFTHEEIYQYIWRKTYDNPKPRVANVVFSLREKLEKAGYPAEKYIQTVHGFGYKMNWD